MKKRKRTIPVPAWLAKIDKTSMTTIEGILRKAITEDRPITMADLTMTTVPERLRKLGNLYQERNKVYGSDYLQHGDLMKAFFPEGIHLRNPDDFTRYSLFKMCAAKLSRYAKNFFKGGHADSLDDVAVYAQMLSEVDERIRNDDGR